MAPGTQTGEEIETWPVRDPIQVTASWCQCPGRGHPLLRSLSKSSRTIVQRKLRGSELPVKDNPVALEWARAHAAVEMKRLE